MASSDIIKIGFDYRSSLAQFEKDTNGVFDGISSKAGKQKITIQLDAKDDKVIDKIKELQKLKLDKFTFEFGNSGLKEQLQTFDKLENKINEIIKLSKNNLSSTFKEIKKAASLDGLSYGTDEYNDELKKVTSSIVEMGKKGQESTREYFVEVQKLFNLYETFRKTAEESGLFAKNTSQVDKFSSFIRDSQLINGLEPIKDTTSDIFNGCLAIVENFIDSSTGKFISLKDAIEKVITVSEGLKTINDNKINTGSETSNNSKIEELKADITEVKTELNEVKKKVSSIDSEGFKNVRNDVEKTKQSVNELNSALTEMKDTFPKTDSSAASTANTSVSAIKEENNALGQTAQSAEKAINSKKKFANANKEVKDSANASVGAIKDENNAFDKNKWDKNVKAIQKYMDAVTELNHLKAKDKGTGKNASVIADQEQEVERLKNIAYEAKKILSSIANSNKADVNTWEKWVNVMKQFDQASQGSTRSIARLEDAMRNANNSQIEYMNSVIKRFQNSYDKYSTDSSRNGYNPSVEFSDKLSSFNSSLNDLKNLSSSISNGEFVKQEQIDSFKRLTRNAEEAQKALKNMSASEKGMKSVSVQKEIDKINQLLRENTRYSKEAKIELRSLITQLMSGDPTVNLEAIHTKVMEIKNAEELAGRAGKNFFDILASKSYYGFIGQMQSYLSMYVGFYGMMNSFRNGLSTVRELNTALTEMRKVSEETTQSLKNYQNTTFDVANVVGTTAKQIQNSTADWMRLGESMSEAAESAKDANILFNVSEFEGIDEATESLVSMSQAYKDLDKMDIINVLNNIGNNYSISTDGLATALKDSASALVTANNDLNEAVSLTTAGNAITQDPSKVGAGLRTISLRLVGTEEAKQELSDLGEETDGMITTVSKLRDTIMDATKAASADGKGFDILDDNGNYKSTYEIMQGLADLYDDIVKKDKELGTNNLNLLLETIAGKNRSNIAASILQNGEMLKSVYEDAQNSEGSAEQELNSYLDSVDGKLQQLSNRAQEFWFKVIDSETIKNGIDLLTNLTKGATDFVDTIGILPTLLTGIGAGIAVKNVGEHYIVPVSI